MNDEPAINAGVPPDAPSASQPEKVGATQGVSLMITRAQRADLRALGYADEAIGTMTPAEAHEILARADGEAADPSQPPGG